MQREGFRDRTTEPFGGFHPCRMAAAIVISQGRNRRRENLDPPGRGCEFAAIWIGAEFLEQDDRFRRGRHFEIAARPELVEVVPAHATLLCLLTRGVVEIS